MPQTYHEHRVRSLEETLRRVAELSFVPTEEELKKIHVDEQDGSDVSAILLRMKSYIHMLRDDIIPAAREALSYDE